jgi:hypothetical protein
LPGQHLGLPIQRQRVRELADHPMRDQRLGRHAAIDGTIGCRCHHHRALAGPAGITGPARDAHPQLRGHDVELLGAEFADRMQRATAAGAVPAVHVDHHLVARQMGRECAVIAGRAVSP